MSCTLRDKETNLKKLCWEFLHTARARSYQATRRFLTVSCSILLPEASLDKHCFQNCDSYQNNANAAKQVSFSWKCLIQLQIVLFDFRTVLWKIGSISCILNGVSIKLAPTPTIKLLCDKLLQISFELSTLSFNPGESDLVKKVVFHHYLMPKGHVWDVSPNW